MSSCDPDSTLGTFWNPATSLTTLRNQANAMAAKKRFRVHPPTSTVKNSAVVSNTLLLKQDAPMLKTNGSLANREVYDQDSATGLLIIPSRVNADRQPFGYVSYKITYRFAGQKNPSYSASNPKGSYDVENLTLQDLQRLMAQKMIAAPP